MKTDMYLPSTGQHYLASSSQVPILERSGWVVYSVWLAQQGGGTTTTAAPAPAPDPAPADTTSSTTDSSSNPETVPAPTL